MHKRRGADYAGLTQSHPPRHMAFYPHSRIIQQLPRHLNITGGKKKEEAKEDLFYIGLKW